MLARSLYSLRLYGKLQLLHFRVSLEYRVDFIIGLIGTIFLQGAGIIFIWVLFHQIPNVEGWNLEEVILLYALVVIPLGLSELCCNGVWLLGTYINGGSLDTFLVRPLSPMLQVLTSGPGFHGFSNILLGIILLAQAVHDLQLHWEVWHYLFLLATVASSLILISAVNLMTNCLSFWSHSTNNAFPVFMHNLIEIAKFPINLYSGVIQFLITWVVPFAFISYYPGIVLLGKQSPWLWLGYITPLAGWLIGCIAVLVWRKALHDYQGTGN